MRVPLVGSYNSRDFRTDISKDQRFVNCFFEILRNPATQNQTFYVHKRDGFDTATTCNGYAGHLLVPKMSTGAINEYVFTGRKTAAFGTTVFFDRSGTALDSITCDSTSGCLFLVETTINNEWFLVTSVVSSSARQYWYYGENAGTGNTVNFTGDLTNTLPTVTNISSTTGIYVGQLLAHANIPVGTRVQSIDSSTQITMTGNASATVGGATITRDVMALIYDADFPSNTVGQPAFLNGRMYIMDVQRRIHASDINSITSWSSSQFITADPQIGYGTGCMEVGGKIVAFGSSGFEMFYDAGNPSGSQLNRIVGSVRSVGRKIEETGIRPEITAKKVEHNLYWVSPSLELWALNGGEPAKISPHGLDRLQVSDILGWFRLHGQLCIVVRHYDSGPFGNPVLVYFTETNLWSEWTFKNNSGTNAFGDFDYTYSGDIGCGDMENTKFYTCNRGGWQDEGTTPEQLIQIGPLDFNTRKRKWFLTLELLGDKRGTSGNTAISWSDDDGKTFSTAKNVDMSTNRAIIHLGKIARRRTFRITDSVNASLRLQALEIELREGVT